LNDDGTCVAYWSRVDDTHGTLDALDARSGQTTEIVTVTSWGATPAWLR
jgi:hypothetical protein